MQVHSEGLSDVDRYLDKRGGKPLEAWEPQYKNLLRVIATVRAVQKTDRVLEVGTGTGWFPILCRRDGIECRGLEISPQLVEFAREYGRRNGIETDFQLGNLEESDLGESTYDVIVCSSVFEHVEHWQRGLQTVFRALKPGGVLFFESTNKFSLTSGEYPLPLYGWAPNWLRFEFRKIVHGPDIMKLGIDFNQFRYSQLRREFKRLGFRRIVDRVDMASLDHVAPGMRRNVLRLCKGNMLIKNLVLTFFRGTTFVCQK